MEGKQVSNKTEGLMEKEQEAKAKEGSCGDQKAPESKKNPKELYRKTNTTVGKKKSFKFPKIEAQKEEGFSQRKLNRQFTAMSVVREAKATVTYDDDGDKLVNQYKVVSELGRGAFGKVKLVINEEDNTQYVSGG